MVGEWAILWSCPIDGLGFCGTGFKCLSPFTFSSCGQFLENGSEGWCFACVSIELGARLSSSGCVSVQNSSIEIGRTCASSLYVLLG